ncbi:MAG: hypothetical protein ABL958_02530 [Bdellovibrionia bacterium]
MARIIEFTILAVLLMSWQAFAGDTQKGQFVKCSKTDCRYKIKIDGELYTFVSSTSDDLNREVNEIFDELEKEKVKETQPFCITGKKIVMKSKKLADKMFKISSIGEVKMKEKTSTPHRSNESAMSSACGI